MRNWFALAILLLPASLFGADLPRSALFPPFDPARALEEEGLTAADLRKLDAGETIVRGRAAPPGKSGVHVMVAMLVQAPVDAVLDAVLDCEGSPGHIPHFVACSNTYVKSVTEPTTAVYEQTEKLRFGFGFISKDVTYTLHMFFIRPYVRGWTFKGGDIKGNEGYYRVIPHTDGVQILLASVYGDPGMIVPDFVAQMITKSDLPNTVAAFKTLAENRAKQKRPPAIAE